MAKKAKLIVVASASGAAVVLVLLAVPIYERVLEAWLVRKLDSKDIDERLDAVRRLGELGSIQAIPGLLALTDTQSAPNHSTREIYEALRQIVARKGLVAVRKVAAGLEGSSPKVRWMAHRALASAGPAVLPIVPEFIAKLRREMTPEAAGFADLLRHESKPEAYRAACGRTSVELLPSILDALHDPSSDVRWLALHALLALGPEGWAAAPRVTELLADPDIAVREHARSVLAGMTRER
jgi:HEAT repeat protein